MKQNNELQLKNPFCVLPFQVFILIDFSIHVIYNNLIFFDYVTFFLKKN